MVIFGLGGKTSHGGVDGRVEGVVIETGTVELTYFPLRMQLN